MSRKTFDVQLFKTYINERLTSEQLSDAEKTAYVQALEHVLETTGNYNGFRYIYTDNERPCLDNPTDGRVCNPNWTRSHELNRSYFWITFSSWKSFIAVLQTITTVTLAVVMF